MLARDAHAHRAAPLKQYSKHSMGHFASEAKCLVRTVPFHTALLPRAEGILPPPARGVLLREVSKCPTPLASPPPRSSKKIGERRDEASRRSLASSGARSARVRLFLHLFRHFCRRLSRYRYHLFPIKRRLPHWRYMCSEFLWKPLNTRKFVAC